MQISFHILQRKQKNIFNRRGEIGKRERYNIKKSRVPWPAALKILSTSRYERNNPKFKSKVRRCNHSQIIYKNQLFVFGGYDGLKFLNSIEFIDIKSTDDQHWNLFTKEQFSLPMPLSSFGLVQVS